MVITLCAYAATTGVVLIVLATGFLVGLEVGADLESTKKKRSK